LGAYNLEIRGKKAEFNAVRSYSTLGQLMQIEKVTKIVWYEQYDLGYLEKKIGWSQDMSGWNIQGFDQ